MEEAALLDLKASLLRDQHRLGEAREVLERAIGLYREANDQHLAGRAMINLATLDRREGYLENAIETLVEAAQSIDSTREPRLVFMLRKNLALFLSEAGRASEAADMLPELRRLAVDRIGSLETLRLRWTEGLIYRRLGQDSWAENSLRRARDGFLESGIGYDTVLVSLDLAALYLDANRRREARLLAAEMIPAFTTRDLHREAIVAVAIFARAAWEEQISHDLVERVVAYLHAARHNPALRFEHVH
jgi:tetratricopeptide (TPR) repeat protein